MKTSVDILCFGAHPDDIEIGMAATVAKHISLGFSAVFVDVTRGERSTNGTVEQRAKEAKRSADILKLRSRINLGIEDGNIDCNLENRQRIVELIRVYKPAYVFAPLAKDRHPDHVRCSELISHAVFDSTLAKFPCEQKPHRVRRVFYYYINAFDETPDLVVDVSRYYDMKLRALSCFKSQFVKDKGDLTTPLNSDYISKIRCRDSYLGVQAGFKYGEGFCTQKPLGINNFFDGGVI
ncbi:MAG TPA: bacillithiol biosynthesis deacetylase BshB1 [Clostridiales bacterium]|nr:bacillithiol biosynthesis deacetylase BshB1 [Clostridiales bacterium]